MDGPTRELVAALRALYERGRTAWPGIDLSFERFEAHGLGLLAGESDPAAEALKRDGPGLYLACACLHRVPGAVDAFGEHGLSRLATFLVGVTAAPWLIDEVRQVLRVKLLVGEVDARPGIAQYKGKTTLERWLKAVAVNTALKLLSAREASSPQVDDGQLLIDRLVTEDPAAAYLKANLYEVVKPAFEEAFATLKVEDRNLLRLWLLDNLSIDRLAALFNIHRASAARRLVRAQEALYKAVKRSLRKRNVPLLEIDSLIKLVRSLELSLERLLKAEQGGEEDGGEVDEGEKDGGEEDGGEGDEGEGGEGEGGQDS
ncbi:MAG TPA: transcriptional regulator [Polyangia bacterium]|jgi:RNA polymerase sigma-70 factor (ECF subfamily)|nr:transcriptional regulator [Polyangia bacterium]